MGKRQMEGGGDWKFAVWKGWKQVARASAISTVALLLVFLRAVTVGQWILISVEIKWGSTLTAMALGPE